MAKDQDPLEDEAPDPTAEAEDTPDDESEDTAEADDSGQSDWTPKDRSEATRKITEQALENKRLQKELEAARSQAQEPDEGDEADPGIDEYIEDQNALLAAELYGEDVVNAAQAVWPLLESAQTTADFMALFEAYHEKRSAGATATEAAAAAGTTNGAQSRQDALAPRVDTNRSDGSPDSSRLEEARKSGRLDQFAAEAAAMLGFGPAKR